MEARPAQVADCSSRQNDLEHAFLAKSRAFGPDLIRSTAICMVLFSHTIPGGHSNKLIAAVGFIFGYLGVEIFFVLSGYLIGCILLRDLVIGRLDSLQGAVSFWKRRWFRTLPNYYLFFFIYFSLFCFTEGIFPENGVKFLWFGQAFATSHPIFFLHAWSLAVEEWFYLLFPIALIASFKFFKKRLRSFLVAVSVFIFAPLFLRVFNISNSWDADMRKVTMLRLDALMYGVLLAYVYANHRQLWLWLKKTWWVGALGLLNISFFWVGNWICTGRSEPESGVIQVFLFNFTSISLFFLFPRLLELASPVGKTLDVVTNLSLWSYSMYLVHPLLIFLLARILGKIEWPFRGLRAVVIFCLVWILTIRISRFIYLFFEKPFMNLRDRKTRQAG